MNIKNNMLWLFYFAFIAVALFAHHTYKAEPLFVSQGPYSWGKQLVWLILLAFLAFSLYCHVKENFFRTLKSLWPYYWHRQIGLDLYIGLLTPLFIIYLNEGSLLVLALWFVPIFIFANLAVLLYLAMNYQSLVNLLVG